MQGWQRPEDTIRPNAHFKQRLNNYIKGYRRQTTRDHVCHGCNWLNSYLDTYGVSYADALDGPVKSNVVLREREL